MRTLARHRLKVHDAQIALLFARAHPPSTNLPVLPFTVLAVDPANVTGHASNTNPGTLLLPILTTSEANRRLIGSLAAPLAIDYLSDDDSGMGLVLSGLNQGTFGITISGTVQSLHNGGTLNAGTTTINPAAGGGGQRQTAHTSDLASFAPFVFSLLGGAAAEPARLVDTVTGSGAWIASGVGTASLTQPINPDGTAGTLTIGDHYTIGRGSHLTLAAAAAPISSGGTILFNDFSFTVTSVGPSSLVSFIEASSIQYNRCTFQGALLVGGDFVDCAYCNGTVGSYAATMVAGLWIPNSATDLQTGQLSVADNIYVTGPDVLVLGSANVSSVFVFIDAGFTGGIQFQDCAGNALELRQGGKLECANLAWGNGSGGFGILLGPTVGYVVGVLATPPSVTGAAGDFAFESNNVAVTVARAWNNAVGAFTEAGGVATRTTTWAHFAAALGAGGFNFQAQCVEARSILCAE